MNFQSLTRGFMALACLEPDVEGQPGEVRLTVDDMTLRLCSQGLNRLILLGTIAHIDPQDDAHITRLGEIAKGVLGRIGDARNAVCLDEANSQLLLVRGLVLANLDPPSLLREVEGFVNCLETWITSDRTGNVPTQVMLFP